MAQTVSVSVGAEDRARLAAILADRNRPQKHAQRANIILLSSEQLPVLEVARRVGVSRPAVWRWQLRYAEQGVEGLLRDKTRKPGRAPLPTTTVAKVLTLTCSEPPGAVTHWTGRAMAKTVGISLRAVQRIYARAKGRTPLHLVSAWASRQRLVLGQQACAEKSNEITAIPLLLERLALTGALVTIDAMGCQTKIAQAIIDKGADYLLAIKENWPTLSAPDEYSPKGAAEISPG